MQLTSSSDLLDPRKEANKSLDSQESSKREERIEEGNYCRSWAEYFTHRLISRKNVLGLDLVVG